jgi:hypothetical protein
LSKSLFRSLFYLAICCITLCINFKATAQDSFVKKRHPLLPHHVKAQFAGGIGFVSIGAGYANKKEKLEGDIFYGYVPKSIGGLPIHALTAKFAWWPIKTIPIHKIELKPLAAGLLVNYTFGKQYFSFSPRYYPFNYYDHPTALHAGIFIRSQLQTRRKTTGIKQWALYYELLTYDVELVSYLGNTHALKPTDILSLGIGIKAKF